MMKNKHLIFFILLFFTATLYCGCSGKEKPVLEQANNTIFFDSKRCVDNYDIKDILDESFSIIPLETTENSVIAAIDKIEIVNDSIYILDLLSKAVYIFDMKGNYIDKLFKLGNGPGEYVGITDMTVTDSSIIIIDRFSLKQIEYEKSTMEILSEVFVFKEIWAMSIFQLFNSLYYLNDWSNSPVGKYRLFSRNEGSKKINNYLSFREVPISLGLGAFQQHYTVMDNYGLVIYNGSDFVYKITKDSIYVEYEMRYKDEKVKYVDGKVENVFLDNKEGRVFGMSSINESDKFLFLDIDAIGDDDYTYVYNKDTGEKIIYNRVAFNSYLDNEQIQIRRIINNRIIDWRDAYVLSTQKEYLYSTKKFKNKEYEKRLRSVLENLNEEDNPVLFVYKLK